MKEINDVFLFFYYSKQVQEEYSKVKDDDNDND